MRRPDNLVRVGVREVVVTNARGHPVASRLDPQRYRCARLAAQLADEWVELVATDRLAFGTCRRYLESIAAFCTHVDATVPHAVRASLATATPDLLDAVTDWMRTLVARHAAGSRRPAQRVTMIRTLIERRAMHPDRPVTPRFDGWRKGALGLRRGTTREVDEFTRADKATLITAAWNQVRAVERRLATGRALAAAGSDPTTHGWDSVASLAWAVHHGVLTTTEHVGQLLPHMDHWPQHLLDLLPEGTGPGRAREELLRAVARMLYPFNFDLNGFRVLLVAATGRTPEEVTGLADADVEFQPDGVLLTLRKGRAHKVSRAAARSGPAGTSSALHPGTPRLDAAEILRRLCAVTGPAADRAGLSPAPLFMRAVVFHHTLGFERFHTHCRGQDFAGWVRHTGLQLDGPIDIRRLRKSSKVEKAIAYRGRVSDIADDHSVEVFRNHYAHGTTLRVIAGNVITSAQRQWLRRALDGQAEHPADGPTVLSAEAVQGLAEPEVAGVLGLSAEQGDELRRGQLDMGVSSCRDPFDSPYGKKGRLCPVAPLRCLECPNAFILPSNLPQLLLFAEHLQRLRQRLAPRYFQQMWGQSLTNLTAVLAERSDAEIAAAREQITAAGLSLQLPLAAHVEFDP
jgi:hypothetical protein